MAGTTAAGTAEARTQVAGRSAPRASRLERRKARTRQALIDAAAQLIAEGRARRASIQEITDAADIGFGSFYNYFDSKEALFRVASHEFLERWGALIDHARTGIQDPAEAVAVAVRISGQLSWTHPDVARFLAGVGLDILDEPSGLAPRALRDIKNGQVAGRFTVANPELALAAVAGGLLGLFRLHQRHPDQIDRPCVDQLAEATLRMLGVPEPDAARLSTSPLPQADG